jgi:hypothetical protein
MGVFFYVLLDGFDLGVGMLFGFARDTASRNLIMNSIAPIWDGNETWLVFGGLGLLAAFPLAFAIIIPAVYFPILLMLLALVFRGVAFEFPSVRRFDVSGMAPSAAARCWRPSRKESFLVTLSRASRWTDGNSAALHSIGLVHSHSPPEWH